MTIPTSKQKAEFDQALSELGTVQGQLESLRAKKLAIKHALDSGDPSLAVVLLNYMSVDNDHTDAWNIERVVAAHREHGITNIVKAVTEQNLLSHHEIVKLMGPLNRNLPSGDREREDKLICDHAALHPDDLPYLTDAIKRGITIYSEIMPLLDVLRADAPALSNGAL